MLRCTYLFKWFSDVLDGFIGAAALLERQMAVFCPNIGVLSASVLSLIPLMRPFAWQSLLLPVLPVQDKMLDLLEAPVPFILGVKVRPRGRKPDILLTRFHAFRCPGSRAYHLAQQANFFGPFLNFPFELA